MNMEHGHTAGQTSSILWIHVSMIGIIHGTHPHAIHVDLLTPHTVDNYMGVELYFKSLAIENHRTHYIEGTPLCMLCSHHQNDVTQGRATIFIESVHFLLHLTQSLEGKSMEDQVTPRGQYSDLCKTPHRESCMWASSPGWDVSRSPGQKQQGRETGATGTLRQPLAVHVP